MKDFKIKKGLYAFKYDFSFKKNEEGKPTVGKKFFADEVKDREAYKEYLKNSSIVKFKDTEFQADPVSINFMSAVLSVASVQFANLLAQGKSPEEAFGLVYGQEIQWKDKKNNWVRIKVGELGEGLQLALVNLKEILSKY